MLCLFVCCCRVFACGGFWWILLTRLEVEVESSREWSRCPQCGFRCSKVWDSPIYYGHPCPGSGRGGLSYQQAWVLFRNPSGWTLHQLRLHGHPSRGEGVVLPLLKAKGRHRRPTQPRPVRTARLTLRPVDV